VLATRHAPTPDTVEERGNRTGGRRWTLLRGACLEEAGKLLDLASKIRSEKGKHDQKSRRHAVTTFTPLTPEKTFLPKRKIEQRKQQKNTKAPKPKQWLGEGQPTLEPSQGEKQISIESNQGDKTKAP
jgi:hypothetical protein